MLADEAELLKEEAANDADIRAATCKIVALEAAGSQVIIEGKGAYYSTVIAGQRFPDGKGTFPRRVNCGQSRQCDRQGTGEGPLAWPTSVTIVTNGRIKCQDVHSNVTIEIGPTALLI